MKILKIVVPVFALLFLTNSIQAADVLTKDDFNILNGRVDSIQQQLDELKAKVDSLTKSQFDVGGKCNCPNCKCGDSCKCDGTGCKCPNCKNKDCKGCKCGCKESGKCNCGKACPCPCGCGESGKCDCKDKPKSNKNFFNSYQSLVDAIASGETGVLYLGVAVPNTKPLGNWAFVDQDGMFKDLPKGVYDCYLDNGTPMMKIRVTQSGNTYSGGSCSGGSCSGGSCSNGSCPNCPQSYYYYYPQSSCPNCQN